MNKISRNYGFSIIEIIFISAVAVTTAILMNKWLSKQVLEVSYPLYVEDFRKIVDRQYFKYINSPHPKNWAIPIDYTTCNTTPPTPTLYDETLWDYVCFTNNAGILEITLIIDKDLRKNNEFVEKLGRKIGANTFNENYLNHLGNIIVNLPPPGELKIGRPITENAI